MLMIQLLYCTLSPPELTLYLNARKNGLPVSILEIVDVLSPTVATICESKDTFAIAFSLALT